MTGGESVNALLLGKNGAGEAIPSRQRERERERNESGTRCTVKGGYNALNTNGNVVPPFFFPLPPSPVLAAVCCVLDMRAHNPVRSVLH